MTAQPASLQAQVQGVGAGAALVSAGSTASISDSAQPSPAAADTLDVIPVTPLEVSILRTPMVLGRSPLAISVLGEQELQRGKSGLSLEEALQGLPGVQLQNRFNFAVGERISVRGFGSRSQFGVRGVTMLVDGIPATLPDGQSTLDHLDPGSLGRVEALRGPASALYGNAAGGVLSFESRMPSLEPFHQEVQAVGGSHGFRNIRSTTSGTAGETGYSFDVAHLGYDGFRTNVEGPDDSVYGEASRLYLNGRVLRPLGSGRLSVTANFADLDAENPGSLAAGLLEEGDRRAFANNVRQATGKTVRQGQLGVAWKGDAPSLGPLSGLRTELSAYGIVRSFSNPIPGVIIDLDRRAGGIRALIGNDRARTAGGIGWTGGVDLGLQHDERTNFANSQGTRGDLRLDQTERVRNLGLFAQATVPVGERLDLLAGLRHDRLSFEADDHFPVSPANPDDSGSRSMNAFSPSIGAFLDLAPEAGLFASVSTFFETPTTTELANRPDGSGGFNPMLEPQDGYTVEGGVRGLLQPGLTALAYEVVLFHTRLSNELVPFEIDGRNFFRNSGASERTGAEASLLLAPGSVVSTRLTYSYTDATFRAYEVRGVDFSGNNVPGLAPHRVEGLLRVAPGPWAFEVRGEHTASIVVDDANEARSPSYNLVDLRLHRSGLPLRGVRVDPFGGVSNATDTRYNASVTVNAFGGRYFEPGPGRSFYLGMKLSGSP